MKKINGVMLFVIVLAMLCCGCASMLQQFENKDVRQRTEAMLDALVTDDVEAGYSLVSQRVSRPNFEKGFADMQELFGDTKTYELKLLSIHTNKSLSGGQTSTSTSADYEVMTQDGKLLVSIRTVGQDHDLEMFYLTPYEKTDYYFTGTIDNMEDATVIQWILLLSNVISLGFTVFAVVDCLRHKVKKKVLWLLLMILGFITFGITVSATGFRVNFNLAWLLAYSALVRYGSGTVVLRIMVPVGVIAYFAMRRRLIQKSNPVLIENQVPSDGQV